MQLRRRTIHKSQPADKPADFDPAIFARDEMYKCPECFFVATFGVPLSEKEYRQILETWNGHRIEDYYLNEQGQDEEVLERLRALGYVT